MLSGYGGGENGCWWMTSYIAGVLCLAGKKSFHGYVQVEVFCDFFCFCFCWCWFWEGIQAFNSSSMEMGMHMQEMFNSSLFMIFSIQYDTLKDNTLN